MKSFDRLIIIITLLFAALIAGANLLMSDSSAVKESSGLAAIETERLCRQFEEKGEADLSGCKYIKAVTPDDGSKDFYEHSSSLFRNVGGRIYRFDRTDEGDGSKSRLILNLSLGAAAALTLILMIYFRQRLIKPFNKLSDLPYELSRGNLTVPLKENGSRYFGKFIWGADMLREALEKQKQRELAFQKDKQTMLLSISHDIKTPLSAIKLSSKALSKGIYTDPAKLSEVYEGIVLRADEIEQYVSQLTASAGDDFLSLEVVKGEMYLSELIEGIRVYYTDKLSVLHTELKIEPFPDCLISCDPDRAAEVLQNLMENAIKYGNGREIVISVSEEEDCRLVTVSNGGCTLREDELIHIFDSFCRGSNAGNKPGSGLGLYICRRLMSKMDGDIFARMDGDTISVTAVFRKA